MNEPAETYVPAAAKALGAAGLIPFAWLAAAAHIPALPLHDQAVPWIAAYGAVILSFLGGIQWGLSVAGAIDETLAGRLTTSVVPSLIGWIALLAAPDDGLLLMAVTFVGVLIVDLRWHRRGWTPAWYPRLRAPLSLTVATLLVVAWMAL